MKKCILLSFVVIFTSNLIAQNSKNYWRLASDMEIRAASERTIIPQKYKTFQLTESDFKSLLFTAPNEDNISLRKSPLVIELPLPDGTVQKFRIVEASIMAPELAAKFSEIKTFNVEGVDDPYANGKLDWTAFGFHGMIRRPSGDFFVDPYSRNSTDYYISYKVTDFKKDPKNWIKEFGVRNSANQKQGITGSTDAVQLCAGTQLRKYRLALACTGEYAKAATGKSAPTKNEILSAITTSVNRVDGIYETELAIRMVLIANEDTILFGDPLTDPFNGNDDADTLIDESQKQITKFIGTANFDIGHTFSTGGGGLADLGCVCLASSKASGITGSKNPVGDPYDVDYVAHEIGHQFGGNHTFAAATGACGGNGNPDTRVEPGSGITIMAYAGICDANDIAPHSIAYFHTISFDEMMTFSNKSSGNSCAEIINTTNHSPVLTVNSSTYTIPASTPFILTGSATDADGDSLTYSWEEFENGEQGDWNGGSRPFFRSYQPITYPSRTFPLESIIRQGVTHYQTTIGEYLPSDGQTLSFRLTARDNKMGGGGVCYASTTVIIANAGPLQIDYPNSTGIIWKGNETRTVTWQVNNTDKAPINCAAVNILVSVDSGKTYTTLLANTPNDGTQDITVPLFPSTKKNCRIKIESAGNIFFDINDNDFTIEVPDGINDIPASTIHVQLLPNPATNQIQIRLSGLSRSLTTELRILDLLGNIILIDEFNGKEEINQNYDLSNLVQGVYMIDIHNLKQQSVSRLLKQ